MFIIGQMPVMGNPGWPRYKHLEVAGLVSGAGGDPWAINESLDAGRPGKISQLADAFHAAGVSTGEAETEWITAKGTFERAWLPHQRPDHPINDSAKVQHVSRSLSYRREKLGAIARDLRMIAGSLAQAQDRSRETIAAVEGRLREMDEAIDRALGQLSAGQELDVSPVMGAATGQTRAALSRVRNIRADYSSDLNRAMVEMQNEGVNSAMNQTASHAPETGPVPALDDPPESQPPRDVGSEQRPGVTDVNDPGVQWRPGFDPDTWTQSWHNPMLADNPPGYTGGPGPERDAAWQHYLANFPTNQRGVLPNPDAVNELGLKLVANAAAQLGTSYAWGGGGLEGPSAGDHQYHPQTGQIVPGSAADVYRDYDRIGFDCSGLTQYAAGQVRPGVDIGTWTGSQLDSTKLVNLPAGTPLKPGDLIYYGPGSATHVGIYVAPGVILNGPQSGLPVQLDLRATEPNGGTIRARRLP